MEGQVDSCCLMNTIADSTRSSRSASISEANAVRRSVSPVMLGILMLTGMALLLGVMGKTISWLPGAFVVIAAIASAAAQSQQLPIQNVLLATGVMLVMATLFETGWFVLLDHTDNSLLAHWPIPLIWVTALFNSRGVAKLVSRRRPGSARYGVEMMVFTIVLGVTLFLAATPIAVDAGGLKIQSGIAEFVIQITGSFFSGFIILLVATPALIDKRPVRLPPLYQPLFLWISIMLLSVANAGIRQLWLAAAAELAAILLVVFLVIGEARRCATFNV